MLPSVSFLNTDTYQLLQKHFEEIQKTHMRNLFDADKNRFNKFSIQFDEILFDYSKNMINSTTVELLMQLANEVKLKDAIDAMFSGEKINATENRAVLHTALRNKNTKPFYVEGEDVMPAIQKELLHMKLFSETIISGNWKGYSGKQIKDVVNIGIGGSDLGPVMVTEALKFYKVPHIDVHFVSNVDGTHISETLKKLNPETTLFLIASKTFTTQETMTNAHTVRKWFLQYAKEEKYIAQHFVAMSTAKDAVIKFGIAEENMFVFWDWVGGRYSLWSAIGLSICLAIGFEKFNELLKGAFLADEHFRNTSFEKNIPVIMGLLGVWYGTFFNCRAHAVIPYDQYLHRFTAYLQQADMESNGKSVDRNGNKINYQTGQIIWGEPGTNGQHAFFQLLHQGTQITPADFIAPAISLNATSDHHQILMSNFFAQTEAMMKGKNYEEVAAELKQKRMNDDEIKYHTPFRVFEGNRPTNTFLINKITPKTLGSLIALYEHKIFVQGIIWNIFSFDQWGVELGKKLANTILPELKSDENIRSHDSSTNSLINWWKKVK
ncbi:MAG: glucose-6-phosphate isomerase [Fimbriimonadaceae bacterium]|nr:glucose-6-phosphate isomerase [Chitinophagales bacterium]